MGGYFSPILRVGKIAYYLIAVVFILLLLFTCFKRETPRLNLTYIILFAIGIVGSMFMAMIYHDQSFLSTAISQRALYFLACFFVWWKIGLTEDELFPMLRVLTIITLVVFGLSLFEPQWFLSQSAIEQFAKRPENSTDVLCFMPGYVYVVLYFFYLLQTIPDSFTKRDLAIAIAILGMFFVYQNRSTLMYLSIITLYFFIKNRSNIGQQGRALIVLSVVLIVLLASSFISNVTTSLLNETQEQLNDEGYNRRIALQFYVFDYNEGSIARSLFGNGQPALDTDYLDEMIEGNEEGAYWSDLGFVGDWFLFGIIPIVAILIMAIKVFRYPYPPYLKYLFASFLLVPTIHTFSGNNMHVFYFSLVMYLVCLNEYELEYNDGFMTDAEAIEPQNIILQDA